MDRQRRMVDRAVGAIGRHYADRARSLLAKARFDRDREQRLLSERIERLARGIVELEGSVYVARLGGDDFDMRQVENYLRTMAARVAENATEVTARDIAETDLESAVERTRGERTVTLGTSIGVRSTVFARYAAAQQSPGFANRMKVWVPDTDRHAALADRPIPIDETWGGIQPGSEPGCKCTLSIL
jgi:hypothetical protein